MGVIPSEGSRPAGPSGVGLTPGGDGGSLVPVFRVQAAFLVGGSVVGILGVVLPHPETFLVPEIVALNLLSIVLATGVWSLADRLPEWVARVGPALGMISVSFAVLFSRDATSAYAMLYVFPGVLAYYLLRPLDAAAHVIFAVVNYGVVIAVLSRFEGADAVASGSLVHHFAVTVGMIAVVSLMLLYLRGRVDRLIGEIVESARSDLQTGLLNLRGLAEQIEGELERARMGGLRVAMLSVQLSGLGDVRSQLGHEATDSLIAEVGRILEDSTRRLDSVGRIGAAEFGILLAETDESTGFLLAEQILARLRRAYRDAEVPVATSIGVASFPRHAASGESLLQAAASAAEAARDLGTDRAVVFSAELEGVLREDASRGLVERRTNLSTVLSLAEVLDLSSSHTAAAHSLSVSRYCELLGRELGLPESRVSRLRLAGMLHDIGKVGIPDSILAKPGPLSPDEWDQVRRHPEMAARILGAQELADIREWILARHEQIDGHGYPRGLSSDQIPIESRILAVAESYDAMTNERPYRQAMTREETIAELGRYAGTQFDGAVVDAMLKVVDGTAVGHRGPVG